MKPHSLWLLTAGAGMCAALCSCNRAAPQWRDYREVETTPPPEAAAPAGEMPPMAQQGGQMPPMTAQSGGTPAIQWKTPDGWRESKGSGMRLASFAIGDGKQDGLCTIVLLGGSAGGVEANIRRWIGQLGLSVSEEQTVAFVKKQKPLTTDGGFDGMLVDFTELTGGGDATPSMLAFMASINGSTGFVKLTGPAGLLKAQLKNFAQLCKSITSAGGITAAPAATGAQMPPMEQGRMTPAMPGISGGAQANLQWTTPDGWSETKGSGMRLATFTMAAGSQNGTCTIVVLGGSAGGVEANIRRWIGQLGLTTPEAQVVAFIRKQTPLTTEGGFTGMLVDFTELTGGGDATPSMLTFMAEAGGSTDFVKLTGPTGLLKAEKAGFEKLCKSLRNHS